MQIQYIHLKNFRRFTDLKIDLKPFSGLTPKLVLLVGANGSGKTCVFDAFEAISAFSKQQRMNPEQKNLYYRKDEVEPFEINVTLVDPIDDSIQEYNTTHRATKLNPEYFYGRSSLRQIPELHKTSMGTRVGFDYKKDADRPLKYIDRDVRFEGDIEHIIEQILNEFFTAAGDVKTGEIRKKYIDPINEAFERIFGLEDGVALKLIKFTPPLEGKPAQIIFKKGSSEFHYNSLSAGEKEIFNILLNLLARSRYYRNTVYFFDEIDLHLNTALQTRFLQEITEHWIPENCQLWTASHSLGFIEYANDADHAAIIDFDELDFDQPQRLIPEQKNKYEVFEIAVSKEQLDKLMSGKQIIYSENKDTAHFNELGIDNYIFFRANNKNDVFYKSLNSEHKGIVDRDYLTDSEINNVEAVYERLKVLRYYSIENYLFHPDNLKEYWDQKGKKFDADGYKSRITQCKEKSLLKITYKINEARNSYPFFKDPDHTGQRKANMESGEKIIEMLQSPDFDTFYKVLPMKDFCTTLDERQNIRLPELAKTKLFYEQMRNIISF